VSRIRALIAAVAALTMILSPVSVGAATGTAAEEADIVGDVTPLTRDAFLGGAEVAFDGRYAYVGQASLQPNLRRLGNVMNESAEGGIRIYDLQGEQDPETGEVVGQFERVGFLECAGTDNYVRELDPSVYGEEHQQFLVVAFHGNACTRDDLLADTRSANGYGARNGIMIVDVTDRTDPQIVSVIGHVSAHTVMPHPTRPYIYILPGGTANGTGGTQEGRRLAPTAIIDASDLQNLRHVRNFEHNAQGCHDLGWTPDGDYAYCAGIQEVQVWDVRDANIERPVVVNTIVNPAIQFAHNAVVSDDGKYLLINDEAFGFHTCRGESYDLYGSLWIYDVSTPDLPLLAGRIAPPEHPNANHRFGTLESTPVQEGWAQSWCASHNYNFIPGTHTVVASWFAGGMTAHDISDPLNPELIAAYKPADNVMWSAHYYGGYVITGDMRRGSEILDVPVLREIEAAAADGASAASAASASPGDLGLSAALGVQRTPMDLTSLLVPDVLPPRDTPVRRGESAFCSIPATIEW
jgi:hypothetical protein